MVFDSIKDREFIMTNKVTHIINCAGTEVQNKWTLMGAKYLTFNWLEQDNEVLIKNDISRFYLMKEAKMLIKYIHS